MHKKIEKKIIETSLPTRGKMNESIKVKLLTIGIDGNSLISNNWYWLPAAGCWLSVISYCVLGTGYSALVARYWSQVAGLLFVIACLWPLAKQLYEDNLPSKVL